MEREAPAWKTSPFWLVTAILVLVAALLVMGVRYRDATVGMDIVPTVMARKLALLSTIRINMIKSVESEKSAVLADTDSASIAFARQSGREAGAAEEGLHELGRLVEAYPSEQELRLLREFKGCWAEFREIDRLVLENAVQNSNLKAALLSFGRAREAVARLEDALSRLSAGDGGGPVGPRAAAALTAALKIHVLHAPHIAASGDAEMDALEVSIRDNDATVRRSLEGLRPLVPPDRQPILRQAEAAYADFAELTGKVLALSRQNTNIKSLELSLNRKRSITAQCDETLTSLQAAVHSRTFKATR